MNDEFNAYPLAQKIAPELGEGWYVTKGHWDKDAFLCDDQGAKLHVSARAWRKQDEGKLEISGSLDKYRKVTRYHEPKHEIKVSYLTKSPARIAGDIERRLLPNYRKALAELDERQRAYDERESAKEDFMRSLLATLGNAARRQSYSDDRIDFGRYGDDVRGDIRVLGDSVQFEIEVSKSHALLLAAELSALRKRKSSGPNIW